MNISHTQISNLIEKGTCKIVFRHNGEIIEETLELQPITIKEEQEAIDKGKNEMLMILFKKGQISGMTIDKHINRNVMTSSELKKWGEIINEMQGIS